MEIFYIILLAAVVQSFETNTTAVALGSIGTTIGWQMYLTFASRMGQDYSLKMTTLVGFTG